MSLLLDSLIAVVGAGVAAREWSRRDHPTALMLLLGVTLWLLLTAPLLLLGVAIVGGLLAWARWGHPRALIPRWGRRLRRSHGVATTWGVLRRGSWLTLQQRRRALRPTLTRERRIVRTRELGAPLCRVGGLRVWAPVEDMVLVFGRPRSGKTGWLVHRVLDAPGAAVVTSTRTDLLDLTAHLRAKHGPVYVFNPSNLGGVPTTLGFDPLRGCEDPSIAAARAGDLINAGSRSGSSDERAFWANQARRVLGSLLHAAALGGLDMHAVQAWVAVPDAGAGEVLRLLRRSPRAAALMADAEQFFSTNDRTRSSITATIMPSLGWLGSAPACACLTAPHVDLRQLLTQRATIYLLGAADGLVAPLVAALTSELARLARQAATHQPGGRLDPPLTLVLDEAALICPVPLPEWSADMGGRGVAIHAAFQSRAQLTGRWGETGARATLGNAGAVVLFALGADAEDLGHWSRLAGEREEPTRTRDAQGRVSSHATRTTPVLSPAQLTQLPPERVVVLARGLAPVVGRTRPGWRRWDVRRAQWVGAPGWVGEPTPTVGATSPTTAPTPGRAGEPTPTHATTPGRAGEPTPSPAPGVGGR